MGWISPPFRSPTPHLTKIDVPISSRAFESDMGKRCANHHHTAWPSHSLVDPSATASPNLSTDTKVNLIIGIFTIVTGILSTLLAWAMWRLTRDRRHRHSYRHQSKSYLLCSLAPPRLLFFWIWKENFLKATRSKNWFAEYWTWALACS